MIDFWNQRYAASEYAYGTEPNVFFKHCLNQYSSALLPERASLLMPAEGEGRNAVYAASLGFTVTAFDPSEQAMRKALKLAKTNDISPENLDYRLGDCTILDEPEHSFDAVGLIYAHFPPALKAQYYPRIQALLKPEALVFLEGFSVNNLPYRTKNPRIGGPDHPSMLFTEQSVLTDFPGFAPLYIGEEEVELNEGIYHVGVGKVIRMIAQKQG